MKKTFLTLFILFLLPFIAGADTSKIFMFSPPSAPNIKWEIGTSVTNIGLSNSLMPANNYFGKKIVFDFDELNDDFNFNLGGFSRPLYFRCYTNKKAGIFDWRGFGVGASAEAFGYAHITETLISLGRAVNDVSGLGAAVFLGMDAPFYFHYKKFNVTIQPSIFFPFFYIDPGMSYVNYTNNNKLGINYAFRVYSIGSMDDGKKMTAIPGMDLKLSAEYPLLEVLDLGLDIISIPIIPAVMKDYMGLSGSFKIDEYNSEDPGSFIKVGMNDIEYGTGRLMVFRPFQMLFWANWRRPIFNFPLFFIPVLGFSVNPIYVQRVSLEAGLTANYDLKELFIFSLGFSYTDRCWNNSLGIVFMLKYFQLDLGLDLRAKNYAQSWQGYGHGCRLGFKVRW